MACGKIANTYYIQVAFHHHHNDKYPILMQRFVILTCIHFSKNCEFPWWGYMFRVLYCFVFVPCQCVRASGLKPLPMSTDIHPSKNCWFDCFFEIIVNWDPFLCFVLFCFYFLFIHFCFYFLFFVFSSQLLNDWFLEVVTVFRDLLGIKSFYWQKWVIHA